MHVAATRERSFAAHASHELAHQLAFNSGLMVPGAVYPVWVVEGLAEFPERGSYPKELVAQGFRAYR